jgi:ribonuclease P protein component
VKRKFRLTSTIDFKRVRRKGKSFAHPLVVLIVLPNETGSSRFGISAGRSVGNAIRRNRSKRQIREIIRLLIPQILKGWDMVVLARKPIVSASFQDIETAIHQLFQQAKLFQEQHDQ